jgi:hypothetical protein
MGYRSEREGITVQGFMDTNVGDMGTMIMYKTHGNKSEVHEWRYYGHWMQYFITLVGVGGGGRVGQGCLIPTALLLTASLS